ncbi:MAG: hypothetical protein ACYCSW_05145 [bacterium]
MKKLLQYLKEKLWFPELKLGLAIALNLVIIGLISIYLHNNNQVINLIKRMFNE